MRLIFVAVAVSVGVLVGCSSADPPDPSAAYCGVVARTADAMATGEAATKRPAMAERRDAAPDEIRADWDTVFELEPMDPTTRRLAQERIDRYDTEHC